MQSQKGGLGDKLIANTFFNFLGQAYGLALSFAITPYIVRRLGAGLFGLLTVVTALGGFAGLLNLGVGRALAKYVSECYWQGEFDRIRALFQTAWTICLVAGTCGFLLLVIPRKTLSIYLFHGDLEAESVASFALFVTGSGVVLAVLTEMLYSIPAALQRFDICNWINILTATVRSLGIVLVLALGMFIKAVLLVSLFSSAFLLLGCAYYARKLVPNLSFNLRFAWADFKHLLGFSAFVFIAALSGMAITRLDRLIVAYYLPIAAVAFYAIPYSLAEKTWMAVGNITSVIFPSASELSAMQETGRLRELYIRATKMVLLAGLPAIVIISALPSEILQFWVGSEFALQGSLTLRLLSIGFLFNIMAHVPFVMALGNGRPWVAAKYSLINGAVNLALFFLLIPRYGIVGAGAAFLLSEALVMPIFISEVNRLLDVPWSILIPRAYFRPFACGAAVFLLLWSLRAHVESLVTLILVCGISLCTYAFLVMASAVDQRERLGFYSQVLYFFRLIRGTVGA